MKKRAQVSLAEMVKDGLAVSPPTLSENVAMAALKANDETVATDESNASALGAAFASVQPVATSAAPDHFVAQHVDQNVDKTANKMVNKIVSKTVSKMDNKNTHMFDMGDMADMLSGFEEVEQVNVKLPKSSYASEHKPYVYRESKWMIASFVRNLNRVTFYLRLDQHENLKTKARLAGMTLNDFMRQQIDILLAMPLLAAKDKQE